VLVIALTCLLSQAALATHNASSFALTFPHLHESSSFMTKSILLALLVSLGAISFPSLGSAQSDPLRVSVANLNQDLSLLSQEVRTLRLEIEEMRRENARLRAEVAASTSNRDVQMQMTNLAGAIETLRSEYRAADEEQKRQILSEVSRQIEVLAGETQDALNSVAEVVGSQPQVQTPVHFSEDYPKTGVTYTVRSGDTLSKIARAHGSTVKHIQNANKIVNPARDLQVGQTIFIPVAQ
jgi:LysM repeat protein